HAQLIQVSRSMLAVSLWYPLWVWVITSYKNGTAGGNGNIFAFIDWIISIFQLIWVIIIVYTIVPNSRLFQENFSLSYLIFFSSNLIKLLLNEIFYYKYKWLNSLTKNVNKKKEFK
ncbi:MAG: hypothetical protein HRT99_04110, partial [Mycoplasmatales bacterium]|nr:hypothetical protein [Mycoplasmatales bacterium]